MHICQTAGGQTYCWCFDDAVFSAGDSQSNCDQPCEGDDTDICGSHDAYSVTVLDGKISV